LGWHFIWRPSIGLWLIDSAAITISLGSNARLVAFNVAKHGVQAINEVFGNPREYLLHIQQLTSGKMLTRYPFLLESMKRSSPSVNIERFALGTAIEILRLAECDSASCIEIVSISTEQIMTDGR